MEVEQRRPQRRLPASGPGVGAGLSGTPRDVLELRPHEERPDARARRWSLRPARERSSTASRDENPREPALVSSDAVDDEILAVVAGCLLGLETWTQGLVARRSLDVASRRWIFPAVWAPRGLGSIRSMIDASEGIGVLDGIGSLIRVAHPARVSHRGLLVSLPATQLCRAGRAPGCAPGRTTRRSARSCRPCSRHGNRSVTGMRHVCRSSSHADGCNDAAAVGRTSPRSRAGTRLVARLRATLAGPGDGLETDACLTADGRLVLVHDPWLSSSTTLRG
jgi:hypothetical protein